jgi:serine/threonine protein phosphatase PrpC
MTAQLRLDWKAQTHEGKVRDHNEDSLFAGPSVGVWAVADGMGGHERGEWASATLVETLRNMAADSDFDGVVQETTEAIYAANSAIHDEAKRAGHSMGTTVVALVLKDDRFAVIWAGDSRAYIVRDGQMHQLSRDHTRVQEMIDRGLLTPEQAEGHPMGHVLSRAVGVVPQLELDGIVDQWQAGDLFLLCSDGLYGVIDDAEIARILRSAELDDAAGTLIETCLARGAPDNVTVVLVKAAEATVLSFAPPSQVVPQ